MLYQQIGFAKAFELAKQPFGEHAFFYSRFEVVNSKFEVAENMEHGAHSGRR